MDKLKMAVARINNRATAIFNQFSALIFPYGDWSFAHVHEHNERSSWGRNGEAVPEPNGCLWFRYRD